MKYMDRVIFGGLLLVGLGFSSAAMAACSTNEWSSVDLTAPSAAGSPPTTSRYSEFCSLAITDTSYVQSDFASDSRYFGRFYVYPDLAGTGTVDLLVAYTDEPALGEVGTTLFKVSYTGTEVVFEVDGSTANVTLASKWNLIEVEYNDAGDIFNYWVNEPWTGGVTLAYEGGPTGSIALSAGVTGNVEAVRLGAPNTLASQAGTIFFDAYEAHRTTNVGALIRGDANGDQSVNVLDYPAVQTEILGDLQVGQPDCNEDGGVNVLDYGCIQSVILGI